VGRVTNNNNAGYFLHQLSRESIPLILFRPDHYGPGDIEKDPPGDFLHARS
jgi:hypothetical protein